MDPVLPTPLPLPWQSVPCCYVIISPPCCAVVATDAGPTALPDTYSTYANQSVLLDPTANDISPTGSLLRFGEWVTVPSLGTINLAGNGTVGQFIYTPQPGMQGVDIVNYTVGDDRNNTAIGLVRIEIGECDIVIR